MRTCYYLRMDGGIEALDVHQYADDPRYNIQAVEKVSGLSSRTLRSWERRYGVPTPQRDDQGRRLYSERDVAIVRWLVARVQQGVAISRAAALLQGMELPRRTNGNGSGF